MKRPIFLPYIRDFCRFFILFGAVLPALSQAQAAGIFDRALKAGFEPHRALYDIRLAEIRSGSQVVNVSGQMLYEWTSRCEAWSSDHQFNLFYEYVDSPSMRLSSDFSTYESFDGGTMNFASQRRRDGQLFEELRGHAVMGPEGEGGKAVYTRPEGLAFDLPAGAVFPMEHSLNVLEKIGSGEKFYAATIFDGSDEKGPVEVNTFIGRPVPAEQIIKPTPAMDAGLLASPAHRVRLAFFPTEADRVSPEYEMSIVFHENGVISDMMVEYQDFSVVQKLVAIEPAGQGCEKRVKAE